MITDAETVSPPAEARGRPFPVHYVRQLEILKRELDSFLLSASGWRKIFGASEESTSPSLSDANKELVAIAAFAFARFLKEKSGKSDPEAALATDTRPTGPAIADICARVFHTEGLRVQYLGVAAGPEIMAYTRVARLAGFAYITASHNPIGHNGFKFGLADGGVIGNPESQAIIASFSETLADAARCASIIQDANSVTERELAELYAAAPGFKHQALEAYLRFTREVAAAVPEPDKQEELLARLAEAARRRGIGVVAELNGSARTLSIDERFITGLGVKVKVVNGSPGAIVHRIVPEGESLEPCRRELERAFASDPGFLLGYVPDNDGDRGNLVFLNPATGRGEILHAQEVFALCCIAELSYLVYTGRLTYSASGKAVQKVAVVVNDPTSLRIDAIAKAFDVRVFRAEVGEANVVNLARDSRNSGFLVRFLGEGSNGGNITHPSAVRDPMNTLVSFLKLLLLESENGRPGLFEIWCARSGNAYRPGAGIPQILATLPQFVTTDISEPRAMVHVKSIDQAALKERFEELFVQEWDEKRAHLESRFGVKSWEEINYEGTVEVHGFGRTYRSGRQRGGLKILFKDDSGRGIAFMWMRGSNTEPIFRVLADARGTNSEDEEWLLAWLVSMLMRADAAAQEALLSGAATRPSPTP